MQQQNFKRNLIAASVAMTLGVSGTAFAAQTGEISPSNSPSISNKATASYSVDGVNQPVVTSNEVTVTISPVSQFSLVAIQGQSDSDDKNEDQAAYPEGQTLFKNKLTNDGNGEDTYTLNIDKDGNDANIDTANPDYQFTKVSDMTVEIYKEGNPNTVIRTKTVKNGEKLTLAKDEFAIISYTATSPSKDQVKGGQAATLTLTATSEEIQGIKASEASLVNESQATIKLPVFSIVKKASVTNINLKDANPTFDYTITVKNDERVAYTTAAINALIQDSLPEGLAVNGTKSAIRVSSTDNSTKQGDLSITTKGNKQVVSLNKVDIAVGETITIVIPVKVADKDVLKAAGSAVNNADVYDNYDDTPVDPNNPDDADIHDSTDGSTDPGTGDGDDSNNPDKPGGDGDPSVVDFSDRSLVIEGKGSKELPPTSAPTNPATHEHVIKNTGNQDESGLKVQITDPAGTEVEVTNVKYDPTPDQPNSGDEVTLNKDSDGKYAIPGTIAKDGGKGKITYDVVTNEATPDDYETTISVTPDAGTNNDAPTVEPKTDTTSVKEIKLVKEHAIDAACDGTPDDAFTTGQIDGALPGQCIVYKITATNEFSSKVLKNIIISDAASQWNSGATYRDGSVQVSSNGTVTERPNNNAGNVKAKFASLAANSNGWVQFAVKINN